MDEEAELERALAGIANAGMEEGHHEEKKHEDAPAPKEAPKTEPTHVSSTPSGDLGRVKNDVLADLRPIIGSVKLPAEEKFELTMRVYDVTKDGGMLEVAYEATKGIADDGKKADSLLRVINEIDQTSK
ncbi:hypothetical protein FWC63_00815 [Candidatus Saccharibacteria bacterium]|nr:hypothetical protein [Candidatus Saccharibacteria bacterium]